VGWQLVILVAALVLVSARRFFHVPVERSASALLGGALMVLFGVLAPEDVVAAVDWATILLLVGMFLVVAVLEATGLFSTVAARTVRHATTPRRLLLGVAVSTAVLSALVLNDAVVLFYTPVVLATCRSL
jgi:Na+/H+ antiporter NhaD/arsenite permease-like protein